MENLTHILVFKTDIKTEEDKLLIKNFLDKTSAIDEWSVDCDDVDCVLRVVSYTLSSEQIVQLITKMGFQCQELE